jgi:hypothetical protein
MIPKQAISFQHILCALRISDVSIKGEIIPLIIRQDLQDYPVDPVQFGLHDMSCDNAVFAGA